MRIIVVSRGWEIVSPYFTFLMLDAGLLRWTSSSQQRREYQYINNASHSPFFINSGSEAIACTNLWVTPAGYVGTREGAPNDWQASCLKLVLTVYRRTFFSFFRDLAHRALQCILHGKGHPWGVGLQKAWHSDIFYIDGVVCRVVYLSLSLSLFNGTQADISEYIYIYIYNGVLGLA